MTWMFHATPARNQPLIKMYGLRPDAPGRGATNLPGVYLLEDEEAAISLVQGLYPTERIVALRINVDGLVLDYGDDDGDWVYAETIPPERITFEGQIV